MRGSTSVGCDQFETSPEAIEQELRPAVCERRPTDRLKANYSIDIARDNNYWIVTNSVQNSPIKSIKMYSSFSVNSTNKDYQSPVTFQDLSRKPIVISK